MNESLKVQPHHLERSAYLYVRQSSMRQVIENVESTKRQYALRNRAVALGWRDDQIIVIDNDQGESGASAAWREGFQRLVTDVGMGHAGIVMGLEVSRLARNNADWHRLLEICALADTLILDEDGVYDPASFNDRLLLGLKGTMSEAELHVLKARLRGGILNKVQRGEYRCPLPTGFVYDEAGNVVLDPDAQIRETIAYFFETFSRVGSASQTVKVFRTEGLDFPSRLRVGETAVFRPLTASTAMRTLNNPRYAGAYAYGRRQYRRARRRQEDRSSESARSGDWLACIPNAHPGYISWERFQENLKILESNGHGYEVARASPPREGAALLQGRAVCGRCGRHFRVRYVARRGKQEAWYVCDRGHTARGEPNCQSIAGAPIDASHRSTRDRRDDACGRRTGPRDQTRDRGPIRRGRSATLPCDRARPDRSGSRTAPIHAGRSEQPSRCRHPGAGMERQTTGTGRGPRGTRAGATAGSMSFSTMRSASGWSP